MTVTTQEPRPISKESAGELAHEQAAKSWRNIKTGLRDEYITAHEFLDNTRILLENKYALSQKSQKYIDGAFKDLRKHGQDFISEQLKQSLIEQINSGEHSRKENLKLAEALGLLGNRFGFGVVDQDVSKTLHAPSKKRRSLIRGLVATVVGTPAVIAGSAVAVHKVDQFLNEASPATSPQLPPTSVEIPPQEKPTATAKVNLSPPTTETPPSPSPAPPTPEKIKPPEKQNFYQELLKPLIEAINKNRLEKARNDPEYLKRIDQELNQDRINVLVYSHGEAYEADIDSTRRIGSFSIISINTKTGKADAVSWTHDLRSPETERVLKARGMADPKAQKMYHAYEVGGTELLGQATENMSGLSADLVLAFPEDEAAQLVDDIFGKLTIDVPQNFRTHPYYFKGQRHEEDEFKQGPTEMDGTTIVKYIKTEAIGDTAPIIINSNRKNKVFEQMLKISALNFYNNDFWDRIEGYFKKANQTKGIDSSLGIAILEETVKHAREKLSTWNLFSTLGGIISGDVPRPGIGSSTYIVSDHYGNGGLEWATTSQNPVIQREMEQGLYTGDSDKWSIQVPLGGNPYAEDLAKDYYPSTRKLVRNRLSFPPLKAT